MVKIASFFSGCGGLDLGFSKAGFNMVFANDNWKGCKETFELNHKIELNTNSISELNPEDIPDVDGFVGGPPCQSWSLAGAMKGIEDKRGQVFYDYIRLLKAKQPKFFLAENVPGMISKTHLPEFEKILGEFEKAGYSVKYKLLNAKDYDVPQERKRVIVIGFRKDLDIDFKFPEPKDKIISLKEAIGDLVEPKATSSGKGKINKDLKIPNNEYMLGGFSTIFMSRNRRKDWNQPSFTIQAGARHAPLHPSSSKMIKVGKDAWEFEDGKDAPHRRMSVRECARIQSFPDDFVFVYDNIADGYKMIGNAVPVNLAFNVAKEIKKELEK